MPERDLYTPSCVLNPSRKKKIRSRAEERGSGETGEEATSQEIDVKLSRAVNEPVRRGKFLQLATSVFRRLDPIRKLSFSGRAGIEGDFGLKETKGGAEIKEAPAHEYLEAMSPFFPVLLLLLQHPPPLQLYLQHLLQLHLLRSSYEPIQLGSGSLGELRLSLSIWTLSVQYDASAKKLTGVPLLLSILFSPPSLPHSLFLLFSS